MSTEIGLAPAPFRPLAGQLNRRLELRQETLELSIRGAQNALAARGLANSSALISALLGVFDEEANTRAKEVESGLRQYRLSLSPSQIVEHREAMQAWLIHFIKQQCVYVEAPMHGALNRVTTQNGLTPAVGQQVVRRMEATTKSLQGLTVSIWDEIVMAAETDIAALKPADRPSFVTINGPVGAFAQGGSTVGSVEQRVTTGLNLAEAMPILKAAIDSWPEDAQAKVSGAQAAVAAEAASSDPDIPLVTSALRKIGGVALKMSGDVGTQLLLSYLRTQGLVP